MVDYAQYGNQSEDPYLLPGSTCLINCLNITDTASLAAAEIELSAHALAELIKSPVHPTFDLSHLCQIHYRLLGTVYPWAGLTREVEISKGGKLFLPWQRIPEVSNQIFTGLASEQLLQGLDGQAFAERAAFYLGRINMMHSFREGNGRTQRIFIDQLAEISGFAFSWISISGTQMGEACRAARQDEPNYSLLHKLLALNIISL